MDAEGLTLGSRTALVLYGSETGNAQDVAEELARMTERLRFTTQISALNETELVGCILCPVVTPSSFQALERIIHTHRSS